MKNLHFHSKINKKLFANAKKYQIICRVYVVHTLRIVQTPNILFVRTHHKLFVYSPLADPQLGHVGYFSSEHVLNRRVQLGTVHLLTSHVEMHPVLLHEQRDVLPVARSQIRILERHHLLFVFRSEHNIQRVGLPVRDDLKHRAGSIDLLHREQRSSGALGLLKVNQQQETTLGLNQVHQVSECTLGHRRDQFWVQDLEGGAVRVITLYQSDPMVLLGHLNELKQVEDTVVISAFYRGRSQWVSVRNDVQTRSRQPQFVVRKRR